MIIKTVIDGGKECDIQTGPFGLTIIRGFLRGLKFAKQHILKAGVVLSEKKGKTMIRINSIKEVIL